MQVTFREKDRAYFKDPGKRLEDYGADLWNLLLPGSELLVRAKSDSIDQEHADWWNKRTDGTSSLRVVCLGEDASFVPDWPTHTCIDVLFTRDENGAETIKGIGSAYLQETKLPFPDMDFAGTGVPPGSLEDSIVSIEFVRKLSDQDWSYYKDLMHRSDKALRLYHSYEEKSRQQRAETMKRLRPRLVWPVISAVAFAAIHALDLVDGGILQWLSFLLLVPSLNYVIRLVRYLTYKG